MTLRKKTLVIIGLLIASLLVILYIAAQVILVPNLLQLEAAQTRQSLDTIEKVLAKEFELLTSRVRDWSAWDDSYAFVQGQAEDYPDSNLTDPIMADLNLNIILFFRPSGELFFGKAFDLQAGQEVPVPADLLDQIARNDLLLRHADSDSYQSGFVLLPEGLLLLAARPIVRSDYTGPIMGTLMMGRFLDQVKIEQLGEMTNLALDFYPATGSNLPADFQAARSFLSPAASQYFRPLDGQTVAGYALLNDLYGQPALLARVTLPREIYQNGQKTITFFVVSLGVVGILLGLASLLLLEWQVLSRLTRLNRSLQEIGAGGDISARLTLPGQDELTQVAMGINGTLARLAKAHTAVKIERDRTELLYEVSSALSAQLDFEAIMATVAGLRAHLDAAVGEVYLLTETGELFFRSSEAQRNELEKERQQFLVRQVLTGSLAGHLFETSRPCLIRDASRDEQWSGLDQGLFEELSHPVGSAIAAPISARQGRTRGAVLFLHPRPGQFEAHDLALVKAVIAQATVALENTSLFNDVQSSLHETHLMLDISRQLSGAINLEDVYAALVQSVMATGAERCILLACDDLGPNNVPRSARVVLVGDINPDLRQQGRDYSFTLADYPILEDTATTQETLVVGNIDEDERLTAGEQAFLAQYDIHSLIVNPLVSHVHVIGMIAVQYRSPYTFSERELALYRTLCNQTTIAIEKARQMQRTQQALSETQTLYRAGRVLAGAADLQELLEEALIEFLYSLNLDQGGITLLTPDHAYGQLMAYVQNGQPQDIKQLRFTISEAIPYQQVLLAGQPFISVDVANDPRLADFQSFNIETSPKSLLEAPMIIGGETIGWIGADAIKEIRHFNQQEIDLARAMADQIAITIQNRRLLEQTERRAERLKAVAKVGETVSGLIDPNEIFSKTVQLIRDELDFYNVSIYLLEEEGNWAVLRASAGAGSQTMLAGGYRVKVDDTSPVGRAIAGAKALIALDVGEDPVQFNYPILDQTHSQMAAPLLSRGMVTGALDVHSTEMGAFNAEDMETLQIMADQLATAIENARLFDQIQRRLNEQAMLYRIGTRVGATLDLQETTDILVVETAEALKVAECALVLLEKTEARVISDYVVTGSGFSGRPAGQFSLEKSPILSRVQQTKQELIVTGGGSSPGGPEAEYLQSVRGTVLAVVPVLLRNQVIAFLELYDNQPGRRFRHEDMALLDSIALQAANALENASLFQRVQESQSFMKAVIDQIPDPIAIRDQNQSWVVVNRALNESRLALPEGAVGHFWEQDQQVFETGRPVEFEERQITPDGVVRTFYIRKVPLSLSQEEKPEYVITLIHDITERKLREGERERLIEEIRQTLQRTQALYRISDTLAAATEQQATFESVLNEYLQLLQLKQGAILLFGSSGTQHKVQALFIEGTPVDPQLLEEADLGFVAEKIHANPMPQTAPEMLLIPLLVREKAMGAIMIDAAGQGRTFSDNEIEIGEAIADQLTIWLENRQLLSEIQHRSTLLQTAADVSRAASSILDIDTLINTSVNLIRDKFDFYYVGLFLLNETRHWAVLRAGTGTAGQRQLAKGHKLEVGGESMIGWSVAHRQARIALDVGQEAVRFNNPDLPETHSEMALPLVSRDEVIGALTVQSTQRGAFSEEDVTVLQTMADQVANAIGNAHLFAQAQQSLAEMETLYGATQELLSAHSEANVYRVAIEAIARSGVDTTVVYTYVDGIAGEPMLEQKAVWVAEGQPAFPDGIRFPAAELVDEQSMPHQDWLLIEDVANDPRVTSRLRQIFNQIGIKTFLAMPLSMGTTRLGYLLMTYRNERKSFTRQQLRFYSTIAQQLMIALENLRLLDLSQRRARREEIIRDITGKIRNSISIEDIMKTTVVELGKVLGTPSGAITLHTAAIKTGSVSANPGYTPAPPDLAAPEERNGGRAQPAEENQAGVH